MARHLWTLAADGDKAIEYSACRFSAFMYTYISSDCIIAYVIHQHSIMPAAIYLRRLELTCFDAPSRLFGPTTQLTRLLSTPVTTFTNRLLVTERPPPAGADSGDCTCFRLDSKTKRVKEQQAAALHCYDKYCSNRFTTGTAHPRQLVVTHNRRQIHNLPSTTT